MENTMKGAESGDGIANPMWALKEMGLGPGLAGLVAEAKEAGAKFEKDVTEAVKTIINNQKVLNGKLDKVLAILQQEPGSRDIQG